MRFLIFSRDIDCKAELTFESLSLNRLGDGSYRFGSFNDPIQWVVTYDHGLGPTLEESRKEVIKILETRYKSFKRVENRSWMSRIVEPEYSSIIFEVDDEDAALMILEMS